MLPGFYPIVNRVAEINRLSLGKFQINQQTGDQQQQAAKDDSVSAHDLKLSDAEEFDTRVITSSQKEGECANGDKDKK